MKSHFLQYLRLRILFLAFTLILVSLNFLAVFKDFKSALSKARQENLKEPGYEFSDFKDLLSGAKRAGFLTNKDMSAERNDGQFLAAQYQLAPVILDLDNPLQRFIVLDGTSLIAAFDIMQKINAVPIYVNQYGKVLAERKP